MFSSLFHRLRPSLCRKSSRATRRDAHRHLAFESLERRELMSATALTDFTVSANTGEKPQSKVWEYADQWYSVMPDKSGTWIWKLNGTQWTKHLQLSTSGKFNADVKVDGNLAHVLLYGGTSSKLATVEFDHGPDNRYEMWSLRPELVDIVLTKGVETATLELDSTGRMWIASDAKSTVEVRYSDAANRFRAWSGPITVASGINSDDISSIIAMPNGSIGVFWSNQSTDRFGFRLHVDGADPTVWHAAESPAAQSALSVGKGLADDHLHMAVASDGTLYVAVKTSYDKSGYPKIALLVRRPSGEWDELYAVSNSGTRPIVVLNEAVGKLIIAYTSKEGGGNILYRESPLDVIAFGPQQTLIAGKVNDVSSTKQSVDDELVLIAGSGKTVKSVVYRFDIPIQQTAAAPTTTTFVMPPMNLAPVVDAGLDVAVQLPSLASLAATVTDDGLPGSSLTLLWTRVSGPGSVTFGDATSANTTAQLSAAGTYVLRLTASDGQLQAFDEITVTVTEPAPVVAKKLTKKEARALARSRRR